MNAETGLTALRAHLHQITTLEGVAGLLSWDQETVMPPKGAAQRAGQCGALETVLHGLRADPRLPDWIAAAEATDLPPAARVTVREARDMHRRATRVPAALATEIAEVTALAQGIWARARAAKRFGDFAPTLAQVLALKREEAQHLAGPGEAPYDALLDAHEPGMTVAELRPLLSRLRPGLTRLRARILEAPRQPQPLRGQFPKPLQLALARRLATALGYDWEAGRLDLAVHPFCSGTGDDVRITTRVVETDPGNCLYSTLHEVGHALYEQGLPRELAGDPAGRWSSMGVHESQSRLFENQIGRSRAFCRHLYREMRAEFGDFGLPDAEALYAAVNRVHPGFIRTEADEVHYNLHILMRFDLETALIEGSLEVADLEEAWNAAYLRDFGQAVTDPADGVLQDVHWSVGLFGYFPTYSLGNIFAAELFAALTADLPDLDRHLEAGDATPARDWLRERIHRHGRLLPPRDLIAQAVGHAPTEVPLIRYLEAKFADLYALT